MSVEKRQISGPENHRLEAPGLPVAKGRNSANRPKPGFRDKADSAQAESGKQYSEADRQPKGASMNTQRITTSEINGGTATSQGRSEEADRRRSFHQIHGARFYKLKRSAADAELRLSKYAEDLGWWVTDTAGEEYRFPEVLECVKCGVRDGELVVDDVPVYFIWDIEAESYVEAPELYEPMQKPESRKLQELLAAGASLRRRFRRFEEEQRRKEAGY